ncbi:TPA: rod shape-determining protein MreD, partial [Clostridioides difficile]|nr:rod shape-determining protein MreD [Clostridioides difficile]
MKKVLLCLLGIVLMTIENSITNYIDIFGISFNLVLIYVTIISLYLDE